SELDHQVKTVVPKRHPRRAAANHGQVRGAVERQVQPVLKQINSCQKLRGSAIFQEPAQGIAPSATYIENPQAGQRSKSLGTKQRSHNLFALMRAVQSKRIGNGIASWRNGTPPPISSANAGRLSIAGAFILQRRTVSGLAHLLVAGYLLPPH